MNAFFYSINLVFIKMNKENNDTNGRRKFLKQITYGVGSLAVVSGLGFAAPDNNGNIIKHLVVNLERCTGCRTCEAACAGANYPVVVDNVKVDGLSNPHNANMKVQSFNPDIDIPTVCAACSDAPCIEACPVAENPETGRKALYRNTDTYAICNDAERCLACGKCERACKKNRVGVIRRDASTRKPVKLCTFCNGEPQCVVNCPFEAITYEQIDKSRRFYGKSPQKVAGILAKEWYNMTI